MGFAATVCLDGDSLAAFKLAAKDAYLDASWSGCMLGCGQGRQKFRCWNVV